MLFFCFLFFSLNSPYQYLLRCLFISHNYPRDADNYAILHSTIKLRYINTRTTREFRYASRDLI